MYVCVCVYIYIYGCVYAGSQTSFAPDHRSTSLTRNCFLLGPYSRTMSRALRWS